MSAPREERPARGRWTAPAIVEMKRRGEPVAVVTAYDFPTARLADEAGVEIVLVGDSLGTVVLGYESTLPVTMECVEKNAGVANKVTSFVLPLGATVNMDGTALYECVAVLFIAQAYGIELTFGKQLVVVFTALLAAIGSAGIPMAGLVMMAVVLKAVGLPLEGIGLILAVDRILDMFRTAINVYGDTCGAVIVAKSEGEKLNV